MGRQLTVLTFLVLSAGLPLAASAAQSARTLAGSRWVLTQYAVQRSAFVSAVGEQRPTLVFGTDGRVSGTTGCNSFGGPYSEAGGRLTIGPVVSTLRACVDNNLARQEQVMLGVMNGNAIASTWEGNTLTLSAPAGMLVFAAANVQTEEPAPSGMPRTGVPTPGWPSLLLLLAPFAVGLGLGLRLRARRLR